MSDFIFNLYTNILSLVYALPGSEGALALSETSLIFTKDLFHYSYSTNATFVFTFKLAICLVFLSAIRGGVPRYRYDFLTKMGWVKFLGLVLSSFLAVFTLVLIW